MKVVVIGGGPGGYPAALKLKSLGADVSVIEKSDFGGTCLNRGCIPSKSLLEIGHRKSHFQELSNFFENSPEEPKFSWEKIKQHKRNVVSSLRTSLEKLFMMKKIEIIRGEASFISPNSIKVSSISGEKTIDFDFAILACGSEPSYPPPFNSFKDKLIDSDSIFELKEFPRRLAIVGAGVIGLEMACFFNALGSEVNIVELLDEILPFEDQQAVKILKNSLEKRGVKFHLGVKTSDIKFENGKKTLILENSQTIEADEILVSTGRKPSLEKLGLENADIRAQKWVDVSPQLQTSNPKVYAVGDVNGISLLAHSAERQGDIAAENIFGHNISFDPKIAPSCIYTWPELASVGMNKKEAEKANIKVKVKKSFFQVLGRAVASMNTEGFCQIVCDENDVILGAQIVGGPATEIIHLMALAVSMKLTLKEVNSMIFAHPTMSEIIKEAINR